MGMCSRQERIQADIEHVLQRCKADKDCLFSDFRYTDSTFTFTYTRGSKRKTGLQFNVSSDGRYLRQWNGPQRVSYSVHVSEDYPDNTYVSNSENDDDVLVTRDPIPVIFQRITTELRFHNDATSCLSVRTKLHNERGLESRHNSTIEEDSEGDNDSEEFYYVGQGNFDGELHKHLQLEADLAAVREIYGPGAVSLREYGAIDDVDIDLHIDVSFLDDEIAIAWDVIRTEPVIVRLHCSLTQYLNGPVPTVDVFQTSTKERFGLGHQLKKIMQTFVTQQWKQNSKEKLNCSHGKKLSEKKVKSPLHIFSTLRRSPSYPPPGCGKSKTKFKPEQDGVSKSQKLLKRTCSNTVKPGYNAKTLPPREHGFLVQTIEHAEQRIPVLNEYCVVCDEPHVFQNGPMLRPTVCERELCVFAFQTLGVMNEAADEIATGAQVVDLLVSMCRSALESPRKVVIFEPYPSVVDPLDPRSLAFNPRKKDYERLVKALDSITSIREMTQAPYLEIKKQMDKQDPLAHPLLQWIISSNRSHIVKLPVNRQLKFMHTPHQFLLLSSPPAKESNFRAAKKLYGSTFAFHGSHIENWHSILRNGLIVASNTRLQLHGAVYGNGIYLSPLSSISFGYSGMNKKQQKVASKDEQPSNNKAATLQSQKKGQQPQFLQSRNLKCIALCEAITSPDLHKHGEIWVVPQTEHVCTRFFFVYEDGQVGDTNINTQESSIHKEILRVIGNQTATG
ncbi:protein mono-ADP-ribosyltransferase PARP8 isoform X3 [Callorhinchus milii]|uniref:protein mono-ADP-ribosyltransferase PARP8 isoform X3 n=1 Tax=Callorhinchus milii TaxID=7868 RepID=UPI001C3FEE4E|nr:protein mono-ADP-ribosyltransferase PARP8 isoform X3 [Callorhinchus milii]